MRHVPGASLYGVFDGHGQHGHLIAEHVKHSLPRRILLGGKQLPADIATKLPDCFKHEHDSIVAMPRLGGRHSGTTATIVIHDHKAGMLTISHLGDSRVVLVRSAPESVNKDSVHCVSLTRDHDPGLPDEKTRIQQSGGSVKDVAGFNRVFFTSPNRLGPGLNMSRSLGDADAHEMCGISAEAEVCTHQLEPCDRVLLVCSDGIWTVMSPQEAADIIMAFPPDKARAAAEKLVDEAWFLWLQGTNGTKADDITATVVYLCGQTEDSVGCPADSCTSTSPASAPSLSRESGNSLD